MWQSQPALPPHVLICVVQTPSCIDFPVTTKMRCVAVLLCGVQILKVPL